MLWDGKSKGTINNVVNLSRRNKLVVVYVAPTKSFQTSFSVRVVLPASGCEMMAKVRRRLTSAARAGSISAGRSRGASRLTLQRHWIRPSSTPLVPALE